MKIGRSYSYTIVLITSSGILVTYDKVNGNENMILLINIVLLYPLNRKTNRY